LRDTRHRDLTETGDGLEANMLSAVNSLESTLSRDQTKELKCAIDGS